MRKRKDPHHSIYIYIYIYIYQSGRGWICDMRARTEVVHGKWNRYIYHDQICRSRHGTSDEPPGGCGDTRRPPGVRRHALTARGGESSLLFKHFVSLIQFLITIYNTSWFSYQSWLLFKTLRETQTNLDCYLLRFVNLIIPLLIAIYYTL